VWVGKGVGSLTQLVYWRWFGWERGCQEGKARRRGEGDFGYDFLFEVRATAKRPFEAACTKLKELVVRREGGRELRWGKERVKRASKALVKRSWGGGSNWLVTVAHHHYQTHPTKSTEKRERRQWVEGKKKGMTLPFLIQ